MKKLPLVFGILLLFFAIVLVLLPILQKNTTHTEEHLIENTVQNETPTEEATNTTTKRPTMAERIAEERKRTYSLPEESIIHTLKQQHLPIMIRFGADYCSKCKEMEPIYQRIEEKTQGKAIITYIDKQKQPDITAQYPIQIVPTHIFVNADGTPYNGEKANGDHFVKYYDAEGNHTLTVCLGIMEEEEIMEILEEMGMEE